jgi:Domain of unknown function (DU1801)
MAANKTGPTDQDPAAFIAAIADPGQRADAEALCAMMARATGEAPTVWGNGMIGFGTYAYRTGSGHEGVWIRTGFAPRAGQLAIHIMDGVASHPDALARLGKHRHGVSCLYVKRLADVDAAALEEMVAASYAEMAKAYPDG